MPIMTAAASASATASAASEAAAEGAAIGPVARAPRQHARTRARASGSAGVHGQRGNDDSGTNPIHWPSMRMDEGRRVVAQCKAPATGTGTAGSTDRRQVVVMEHAHGGTHAAQAAAASSAGIEEG